RHQGKWQSGGESAGRVNIMPLNFAVDRCGDGRIFPGAMNGSQHMIGIVRIEARKQRPGGKINHSKVLCGARRRMNHEAESEQQNYACTKKDDIDAVVLGTATVRRGGNSLFLHRMDGHGISTFTAAAGVPEQEWYRIDYGGVGG